MNMNIIMVTCRALFGLSLMATHLNASQPTPAQPRVDKSDSKISNASNRTGLLRYGLRTLGSKVAHATHALTSTLPSIRLPFTKSECVLLAAGLATEKLRSRIPRARDILVLGGVLWGARKSWQNYKNYKNLLQKDLERIESGVLKARMDVSDVRVDVSGVRTAIADVKKDTKTILSGAAVINARVTQNTQGIAAIDGRTTTILSEVTVLNARVDQNTQNTLKELAEMKNAASKVQEILETHQKETLATLTDMDLSLNERLATLQKSLDEHTTALASNIAALQESSGKTSQELHEIHAQVSEALLSAQNSQATITSQLQEFEHKHKQSFDRLASQQRQDVASVLEGQEKILNAITGERVRADQQRRKQEQMLHTLMPVMYALHKQVHADRALLLGLYNARHLGRPLLSN